MAFLSKLARAFRGEGPSRATGGRAAADASADPGSAAHPERHDELFDEAYFFSASTVTKDRRWVVACRESDAAPEGQGSGSVDVDVYVLDLHDGATHVEREAFALPPAYPLASVSLVVRTDASQIGVVALGDDLTQLWAVDLPLPLPDVDVPGADAAVDTSSPGNSLAPS